MKCSLCGQDTGREDVLDFRSGPSNKGVFRGSSAAYYVLCRDCAGQRAATRRLFWWLGIGIIVALLIALGVKMALGDQ